MPKFSTFSYSGCRSTDARNIFLNLSLLSYSQIYEGTSQIQKMIIAKEMLGRQNLEP